MRNLLDIDDEHKCVMLLNLLHRALSIKRIRNDLARIGTGIFLSHPINTLSFPQRIETYLNSLAWILWRPAQL